MCARGERTTAYVEARFRRVLRLDTSAMFSRVAGANRPRGAILALALVALAARVSLANAESSANASCRTGDECDADDAFPDGSSERAAHPPSPPPIRSPRRPSAILAAPFEDDRSAPSTPADSNANRNLPRHLFRPLPFLPDPDASSSAPPSQWAPTSRPGRPVHPLRAASVCLFLTARTSSRPPPTRRVATAAVPSSIARRAARYAPATPPRASSPSSAVPRVAKAA